MARGAAAALPLVEALIAAGELDRYHLLYAVHGDVLAKLGRREAAARAIERAASLTRNDAERAMLAERAARLAQRSSSLENPP